MNAPPRNLSLIRPFIGLPPVLLKKGSLYYGSLGKNKNSEVNNRDNSWNVRAQKPLFVSGNLTRLNVLVRVGVKILIPNLKSITKNILKLFFVFLWWWNRQRCCVCYVRTQIVRKSYLPWNSNYTKCQFYITWKSI